MHFQQTFRLSTRMFLIPLFYQTQHICTLFLMDVDYLLKHSSLHFWSNSTNVHFIFYGLWGGVKNISQYDEPFLFSIGICICFKYSQTNLLTFFSTHTQRYFQELCMMYNHSVITTCRTLIPIDLPPKKSHA